MFSRRSVTRLLAALAVLAIALPVAAAVVFLVRLLLGAMADEAGANVLNRLNLAIVIAWLVDLALLIVAQAVLSLLPPDQTS